MRGVFAFLSFFLSIFLVAAPVGAAEGPRHTSASIFSAVEGVDQLKAIPAGVEVWMADGWKTYWRTPGEAGLAPVFDWSGSSNLKEARVQWPAPHRFVAFDIDNYGYEGHVVFPIDLVPEVEGQPVTAQLRLDLLICNRICVPETHRLELKVPAGPARVSSAQDVLAKASKKVPTTLDDESFALGQVWLQTHADGKIYLHAEGKTDIAPAAGADLFVEHPSFVNVSAPSIAYDAGSRQLHMAAQVQAVDSIDAVQEKLSSAPLVLTFVNGDEAFERRVMLGDNASAPANVPVLTTPGTVSSVTVSILLVALLGGLILNLMPCVLPVLSIKILSVLKHGGKDHRIHRWKLFGSFMASAAGIVFSFWVLAGALALLKSTGQSLGWGIQFQHPAFLVFLIVVLALFAANMWGMFEIPLPRAIARHIPTKHEDEPTLLGHFLTGAFATLLATPCTAPFLGTAVGFALAGTASDIFTVFTFLGLGLALPYIVLAVTPRVFRYMPRPGKWMVTVRKVMAVALVLTAVWLINVLVTVTTQPTLDEGWQPFNEALIMPTVGEGRTVIVDITADWCLTCKANKRLVLDQADVRAALSNPNILRMQADWTQRNETIAGYLRKYGRYGVPFNIVYGPAAPQGIILNELLTKQEVLDALSEASGE